MDQYKLILVRSEYIAIILENLNVCDKYMNKLNIVIV